MIVGTQDGTTVTFTPGRGPATGASALHLDAGTSYSFALDDGDVIQIYSGAQGEDLTGATVAAVAAAEWRCSRATSRPATDPPVTGINSADMAHEQMPPVPAGARSTSRRR